MQAGLSPFPFMISVFSRFRLQSAFTMVELVIVLALIGILSSVGAARFFDNRVFAEKGYFDDLLSALRYAQKVSVASGCELRVNVSTVAGYDLKHRLDSCTEGAFTRDIINPGKGSAGYAASPPGGVAIQASIERADGSSTSMSAIVFDALGSASMFDASGVIVPQASRALIRVGASREVLVQATTGFVCGPAGERGCR